jgi:hypothetical protein
VSPSSTPRVVTHGPFLDRYASAVLTLVKKRYAEADRAPTVSANVGRPGPKGPVEKVATAHGVLIPVRDEDWPDRTLAEKAIHLLFRSPFYPVADRDERWESAEDAVRLLREELGARAIPKMNVEWRELTSDAAQSRLAFAGLGSLRLDRLSDEAAACDPDGARWVVDLRFVGDYEVRDGFERFGAAAWFGAKRELLRITWSHGGRDVYPGDPLWEHAKYAWRASLFVGVTIADHLWGLHLRSGNEMVIALREQLSEEHPVRLLLKPFTYRTISVAHRAANTLVVERGLPHRGFALTYEGLTGLLAYGTPLARLETFPTLLASRGTAGLEDFPYGEDGMALWALVHRYVEQTIALHFPDDASIAADGELQAFWRVLEPVRSRIDAGPLARRAQLVDLCASFLFYVTGLHEHVGSLCEYLLDPRFMGGRIRTGLDTCDVQGSVIQMLLMAGTSLRQPGVLEDYTHILPRVREAEARAVMEAFRAELVELAAEIDRRNAARAHPFRTFDPKHLEVSVSL